MKVVANLIAFIRGGTHQFSELEQKLIDSVADTLEPKDKKLLLSQLSLIYLVQRPQKGKNAFCYYPKHSDPLPLPYPGDEYCLASVSYMASERNKGARIFLHNGVFQSLEGNLPTPTEKNLEILEIKLHPKNLKSNTIAIDKYEHADSI